MGSQPGLARTSGSSLLHGGEEILQSLEIGWETVILQTGWQLEHCTKPILNVAVSLHAVCHHVLVMKTLLLILSAKIQMM